MSLTSHANVRNSCLHILHTRGYKLKAEAELMADGDWPTDARWTAEKDGFFFTADNPMELLGLVAIYDFVQPSKDVPYWWRLDCPDHWDNLMEEALSAPPANNDEC